MKPIIDLHAHVLPAVDHGCADLEECLAQLKLLGDCGVERIVATPHFYPNQHSVSRFLALRDDAVNAIRGAARGSLPKLYLGAEVLLCENLHQMEGLSQLCVEGTSTLLLELPTPPLRMGHFETVEELIMMNYTVVLAHIDRYVGNHPDTIKALVDRGALAQINAEALTSASIRRKLEYYIERTDCVCGIGSDIHGTNKKYAKALRKAMSRLGSSYGAIYERSAALLENATEQL